MTRAYSTALGKGSSDNSSLNNALCMAEWMLSTGKTSEDWHNLPVGDVKLLTIHILGKRQAMKADMKEIIGGMFSGRKK